MRRLQIEFTPAEARRLESIARRDGAISLVAAREAGRDGVRPLCGEAASGPLSP